MTRLWYDQGMRGAHGWGLLALCGWLGTGCGGEPVRGAIPTVPEDRIERPETGPIPTQPKEPPPPPELPPPSRATLDDEQAGRSVGAADSSTAEQVQSLRTLSASADAQTRERARVDQVAAQEYLERWERERRRAREEALEAERARWAPHRAEGVEEWLTRARDAAGAPQHPRVVAAEAVRQAQAARDNADRANLRAVRARDEADSLRRFARVTVREWVPIPGTGADLERTEARALELELEALRARIAAEWAEEAARRAALD